MNFRPETLVHRVILKPHIEKQTASGILLARDERSQAITTNQGTVYMIGPRAWKDFGCDEPPVNVGDNVYYAHYGAKVLKGKTDNEFYVVCNDEDILVGYTNE